ncbi:MAG: Trk system potassium transporter TrkA [Eubacterium sp.]|nr:Trk system potassium transporter TrkA [Eubacterium sp.]
MFGIKSMASKGLNIIIVGGGKVGATLVEALSTEGHDVTIVDSNRDVITEMANLYDVMGVEGNGASYMVLREAGLEDCDLIVAVTESDELNLLCCTIAGRSGKCATVARVRTPEYMRDVGYLRDKLGLTLIINPDLETAEEMTRILCLPNALDVSSFAHGQAEMVRFKLEEGNQLIGKSVMECGTETFSELLICGVERKEELCIPNGSFVMEQNDIVTIVASRTNVREFFKKIGNVSRQVKDVMIVGGGKTTYYLGQSMIRRGISVKIIEKDKQKCDLLSILMPKAIIINGDGTDQELLIEEGIEYVESFIPLTGIDEENIMLTLFAKQVSNAKVITKINRMTFKNVINQLDLGSVIFPRILTSEKIIAYARAKNNSKNDNIETLRHLFDSRAEAIEFRVDEASVITAKPIRELKLKKNVLICSIYRRGKFIIPSGSDQINLGDNVIVVTTHSGFEDIKDILER